MESPEGDRIKAASSTTPASSPAVQESPFFNFISNLSPINSVKAAKSTQRFSYTQFPTPPPVFRTPRLDLQRETCFLKSNEVDAASTDVYGDCGNRLSAVLVPCIKKELLSCSPSGCVDDYLTDPVEAEGCINSNDLCVQPAKNVSKLSRSGFTAPIITSTKVNDANDRNSEEFVRILPDQTEVDPLRSLILFETASDERDAERFDRLLELTPKERADQVDSNRFHLSSVQHHDQNVSQNAGIQHNGQDGRSQSPENLQNVEADKNSSESLVPVSKGSVKESTLHQRGIRRHLQFEAALAGKGITTTKSHSSHVTTQESDNSALPASLGDWESPIPSDVESREISTSREATSSSHNVASRLSFCQPELVRSSQHDGSLPIPGPFPYGCGSQLSSIAESVPMSSDLPSKILPNYTSSQQDKHIPEGHNHFQKDSNSGLVSNVAGKIHAHMDKDPQDDETVVGASSVTSQYTDSMKLLCDSMEVTIYEQQAAPCEGMMLTSENTDRVEELNQVSPKKKRKKSTYNSESEGCKRCNCKRSRCLKLYCECFAASVYCIDSCACESCFNKPEYEETVTDMRQQIESRNPLAFAPKIVNHATDSPANVVVEVGNLTTPASARHKRGCNCKKSKCLKKYCECFQANVGCSDGCRCEGCSNSFGKKTESKYRRVGRWENQSHVQLDTGVTVTDSTKAETVKQFSPRWEERPDMSHLTPLSYSIPGAETSSASPNIREYQNVPRPQLHHQSSFKSSAVNPLWHSPMSFTPQSYKNDTKHGLCSNSAVQDRTKEDNVRETQKDTSTPTNASRDGLPNKKQVSQPQSQSQELRSNSSPGGLQSDRKFILQTMPSFPPLTPYSKTKDDVGRTESDFEGDPSDN